MAKLLVLHGPNLNLLGLREPSHYGRVTLQDIERRLQEIAANHALESFQSNSESDLIEKIHASRKQAVDFIIFNPAAFTHTSIALRDALLAVGIPFIEVHLSNVHPRGPFCPHSYFSDIAQGVILGLGSMGYELAVQAALTILSNRN